MYETWKDAKNVCVIGAGTMGSGIAAHLANIGFNVTLMDLNKDQAVEAFARARSLKPPHFYLPDRANEVRIGGMNENLEWISEADWVCEAIIEKLDAKKQLFTKIDPLLKPDAMVSTNTSGLQISLIAEALSEPLRKKFIGSHFFNPPRYLKLLELIPTNQTDPAAVQAMSEFIEDKVARRVVVAKDTPGFIANRYGMWCMFQAIHAAEKLHLSVEQVDAITGPFFGRPRSASFRLNDLVGLDIMQDIAQNLISRCPDDPHLETLQTPKSMAALIEKGWIGSKKGQGYYRKEGRELLALDLQNLAYRQKLDPDFPSLETIGKLPIGERLREALKLRDEVGEFTRNHLVPILKYADYLKEEISHNVRDFDRVMMWGFGWQLGPFGLMDAVGRESLGLEPKKFYQGADILGFDGKFFTPKPEPQYVTLKDLPVVETKENFCVRDMGDDVLAIGTTTKMGVITPALVRELYAYLEHNSGGRYVLTSESKCFSVGFDLKFVLEKIQAEQYDDLDQELLQLQKLGELLEKTNIVSAVFGYCLGAGLETAISCPLVVTHPEAQIALPEAKVGLLPAGRGTACARLNNQINAKRLAEVCQTITLGVMAANADHARQLGYLRGTDKTIYHPDRLLYEAKQCALTVKPLDRPNWTASEPYLTGMIDSLQEDKKRDGSLTNYDEVIGDKLKMIFAKTGSYEDAIERERKEFLDLCKRNPTQSRIRHMLETGKPLRN